MTALRSLLFLILAPGMVAGYIPLAVLQNGSQLGTGIVAYLAFPLWGIGAVILLWSFWNFLMQGRGTPAPFDPPREFVASGPYRYVRNPMYLGAIGVLLGAALMVGSASIVAMSGL